MEYRLVTAFALSKQGKLLTSALGHFCLCSPKLAEQQWMGLPTKQPHLL